MIITIFSRRKREVKKLATSGMQNSEIAEKLNIYLSSVKHAIRIFSGKTGTKREDFAAFS